MRTLLIGLTIAVSGCMTMGNQFDTSKIDQLEVGKTTLAQAIETIGTPVHKNTDRAGRTLVQWRYYKGGPMHGNQESLGIVFDKDGKMEYIHSRGGIKTGG